MTRHFYTLEMGRTYGPKLERLAVKASYEDFEQFAAIILCHALDAMEARNRAQDAALAERLATGDSPVAGPESEREGEMDDDIPF